MHSKNTCKTCSHYKYHKFEIESNSYGKSKIMKCFLLKLKSNRKSKFKISQANKYEIVNSKLID